MFISYNHRCVEALESFGLFDPELSTLAIKHEALERFRSFILFATPRTASTRRFTVSYIPLTRNVSKARLLPTLFSRCFVMGIYVCFYHYHNHIVNT